MLEKETVTSWRKQVGVIPLNPAILGVPIFKKTKSFTCITPSACRVRHSPGLPHELPHTSALTTLRFRHHTLDEIGAKFSTRSAFPAEMNGFGLLGILSINL